MLNSLMMISLNSPKPFSDEAKDLIKAAVQRHQEIFQTSHVIQQNSFSCSNKRIELRINL